MRDICDLNFVSNSFYDNFLNILTLLDSDVRRDIFICIIGLMIAIIVFIAEIISNKKYEVEKRLILEKTKIVKRTLLCVCVCFLMLFSSFVKSTYNTPESLNYLQYVKCDFLYIIFQSIINILIIIVMIKTICILVITIKLNSNNEYFSKQLDEYIHNSIAKLSKRENRTKIKNIKKRKIIFENYIEKNNNVFSMEPLSVGLNYDNYLYLPVYSEKKGIIKSYNYNKIESIIQNINKVSFDEITANVETGVPLFVFAKSIGEKVKKNDILGYYLNGYKKYFEYFPKYVIFDDDYVYIDNEERLINDNVFKMATDTFERPFNFDEDGKLYNYFNFLYKNNYNGIKCLAINKLYDMSKYFYNNAYKNKKFIIFLNEILFLAYVNKDYEDFKSINNCIYFLFYQQTQNKKAIIKDIAYNFANQYFKFNYLTINKSSDLKYYDSLMSYLLRFLRDLLINKQYDSIDIVFQNILLEHLSNIFAKTSNEKDIANFQFACGMFFCLILFVEQNDLTEDELKFINNIIKWIKSYFVNIYDSWQIIIYFKNYFNKKSEIQNVYSNFEFDFIDTKYLSSYAFSHIDEKIILREFLCIFNINYISENEIDLDAVSKEDKRFFEDLKKVFNSSNKTNFEKKLNRQFNNNYDKLLDLIINEVTKKEIEFNQKHKLDKRKLEIFKNEITTKSLQEGEIEKYLKQLDKVEKADISLQNVYGIKSLLSRNFFFEESNFDISVIINPICTAFKNFKEMEFIKIIEGFSKPSKEKFFEQLLKMQDDLNDYLLIMNYENALNTKGYDRYNNILVINGIKIEVLILSDVDCLYLIDKKYLPRLQYCSFEESFSENNIKDSLYYELKDCSENESLRDEIIKNSQWLSEIGDCYNQNEYLKQKCLIELYLSFRYNKEKGSTALKFDVIDFR